MNLYLTLLVVYSVALVAIGVSISRLVKGSADFFVAGRALTAPLLFSTVLASIISAFVVTVTFMAGGLIGTAWINVVQLTVLMAGFAIAVPFVLAQVGGLDGIAHAAAVPPHFMDMLYSGGPLSGWTLLVFAPAF